jgi:nitroreductase
MHEDVRKILARRSTRAFTDARVTEDMLRDLLKAAMAAPSVASTDPWRFVVVRGPSVLARLAEQMSHPDALAQARTGIVVCGDLEAARHRQLSYLLQDCSAAVENLLLAASMMGLGACRLCIHPRSSRVEEVRRLLELPAQIIPVAAIALGHPKERKEARTRFDEAKVHQELW